MAFLSSFQLPASANIQIHISKALLKRNDFPESLLDEIMVQNGKGQLYDRALIAPRTCAIPVFQDDTRLYDEIHILTLAVLNDKKLDELEARLFGVIPYPLILIAQYHDAERLSLAHFRTNAADKSKNVITDVIHSRWFEADDSQIIPSYRSLPKENLYQFYSAIFDAIVMDNARQVWPNIDTTPERALSILKQYDELNKECLKLQSRIKKGDLPFAQKCMLSTQIQNLKRHIEQLPKTTQEELFLHNGDTQTKTLF